MSNRVFIGLGILAAGVLVGWYFLGGNGMTFDDFVKPVISPTVANLEKSFGEDETTVQSGAAGIESEKGGGNIRSVVTYTNTGFSPNPLSVNKGTTVTFVNESDYMMSVASATYPLHQLLPGFVQETAIGKGKTYEYTFTKIGTWKYQNDNRVSDEGRIVVTE